MINVFTTYTWIITIRPQWLKVTHILSSFTLNFRVPFRTSTVPLYFLTTFWDVYIREKEYLSIYYGMYANASNNAPSYTHISLYLVWRVHTMGYIVLHNFLLDMYKDQELSTFLCLASIIRIYRVWLYFFRNKLSTCNQWGLGSLESRPILRKVSLDFGLLDPHERVLGTNMAPKTCWEELCLIYGHCLKDVLYLCCLLNQRIRPWIRYCRCQHGWIHMKCIFLQNRLPHSLGQMQYVSLWAVP